MPQATEHLPHTSSAHSETPARDPFTVFTVLWMAAMLFQQMAHPPWTAPVSGIAVAIAAVFCLLQPRSLPRLSLALVLEVCNVWARAPQYPNQLLFSGFVDITILLALLGRLVGRNGREDRGSDVFQDFAPVVRIELLLLYGFAVLHKLNHDFVRPDLSCAASLLTSLADQFPFMPAPTHGMKVAAVWGSPLVEAAIPLLLCLGRTRLGGVGLGIVFHLVLSLHLRFGIFSFSAMHFALFALFIPQERLDAAKLPWQWGARRDESASPGDFPGPKRGRGLTGGSICLLAGALCLAGAREAVERIGWQATNRIVFVTGYGIWLIYACVLTLFFIGIARARVRMDVASSVLRPRRGLLLIGPALVLFNGLNPYLGLKTLSSMEMFSNLRTEGDRTNHFFMPQWLRVARYQDELVEILGSSQAGLQSIADRRLCLPYFELRRRAVRGGKSFWVEYRRSGEIVRAARRQNPEHELFKPVSWLERKWLAFQAVERDGPHRCEH